MKKVILVIVSALFLAGLFAVPVQAAEIQYSDIKDDAWYAWCVADATKRGLMNGTGGGTFTPDGDLTRAMLVTVLWRLAGEPEAEDPAGFTDVPEGQWYSDAVSWAASNQVVEGYGGGVFGPTDPVTREQMAVIFYRWAQGKGYDVRFTPNERLLQEESDIGRYEYVEDNEGSHMKWVSNSRPIGDWAKDAVQWAAEQDLLVRREVRGQDATFGGGVYRFCVWENATRAEVAVFLSRFCRNYVDEAGGEEASVLLHPDENYIPIGGYHWDLLSMELPETWMGSCNIGYMSNMEWKPALFAINFWDLTNHEPRSSKGWLFSLQLLDAEETKDVPDAAPGVSGRLCTVKAKGIGKLDLLVSYPGTEPDEDGFVYQYYDPDNPRSYLKMQARIGQVLRSVRFSEGVKVLYQAPFLSAPLDTKTDIPTQTAHAHVWDKAWNFNNLAHWHECTAGDCSIDQDDHEKKDGYAAHVFTEWTVTTQAGERTPGYRTRKCTVCHFEDRETIPATLPTADSYTLDLRNGPVRVEAEKNEALKNTLQAAGAFYGQQPLSGEPAYYQVDLDADGAPELTASILSWETAPDRPRKPTAMSYETARSFQETELTIKPTQEALDRYLSLGEPIFGQVIIRLSSEN